VANLPARVLLTTGVAIDGDGPQPPGPHVRVERWVPQADVLAQAAAVVCHGGSGTTLGALAAGVPLVVTPLFADQPYNGRRVAAVGAGLVVEPRDQGAMRSAVDPGDLRDAIATVMAGEGYGRAAAAIAADIRGLPARRRRARAPLRGALSAQPEWSRSMRSIFASRLTWRSSPENSAPANAVRISAA
jgi:UDP:flavonoid glycosyltransferase YjiC (YdhE family)